jgi:hypothetical protein
LRSGTFSKTKLSIFATDGAACCEFLLLRFFMATDAFLIELNMDDEHDAAMLDVMRH